MYFNSFEEFIHMGGHGFYVWLCYALVSFALVGYFLYSKSLTAASKKELFNFYRRMDARKTNASEVDAVNSNPTETVEK